MCCRGMAWLLGVAGVAAIFVGLSRVEALQVREYKSGIVWPVRNTGSRVRQSCDKRY